MSKLKDAGTRFPFINLQKAMERAKLLFDADERGREMTIAAAFGVWGYSEKSSGGFQTIAALKSYGLLKEGGGSDSRKIALSEDALRYFRDERPDEKVKLLAVFAQKPKLIAALLGEWGPTPPADTIARSHLKTEVGLNDQSARSLLAIYKENVTYAKLKGGQAALEIGSEKEDDSRSDEDREVQIGDLVQVEIGGVYQLPKAVRVRAIQERDGGTWVFVDGSETGIPMEQVHIEQKGMPGEAGRQPPRLPLLDEVVTEVKRPGSRREVFALDEGDVVLTFPEDLSVSSYEDLASYIEIFLRKMKRRAETERALNPGDDLP